MQESTHPLTELLRRDNRYRFDAYVFVFDALRYGQEKMDLGRLADSAQPASDDPFDDEEQARHVTGQELCEAIRRYALEQYGLMAKSVLNHWGVRETGDFGEIVFNLIDIGQMRKTDSDRREDFEHVYDFDEALADRFVFQPLKPSGKSPS